MDHSVDDRCRAAAMARREEWASSPYVIAGATPSAGMDRRRERSSDPFAARKLTHGLLRGYTISVLAAHPAEHSDVEVEGSLWLIIRPIRRDLMSCSSW
jgi:hypothetical protein